ncbi:amidase signature domain-containing protein [Xylaria intraflava]|nr:amidase signature domain-containing protein [Xylaria intraflava]
MSQPSSSWQAKAAAKRADTLSKIPAEWKLSAADIAEARTRRDITGPFIQGFLKADEVSIVLRDSVKIVEDIKAGKLTAVQVTTAFCKTAAIAHQINDCLLEIFFDQALERAKWLDAQFAEKKSTVGPLHGLPISLKDQFHVKGVDTTMGYVGWIGGNLGVDPKQTHKVQSQITEELLSLGAVLYCKTTLPQTVLFGDTKNNITGQTLNPQNRNLSCGGSSGGEGALQALRGSTLGLGTDIGGSVRSPAACNGLFGLKPTPERISYRCVANTNPGQNTYRSAVGILSTSLGGVDLLLRADLSTKPWLRDPAVVPMPFRDDVVREYEARANLDGTAKASAKPLKLGVFWTDGVVQPHPPVTRGLRIVADAVKSAGHKIVDWEPPAHDTATKIHVSMLYCEILSWGGYTFSSRALTRSRQDSFLAADGRHDIHGHLARSGEPLIPELEEELRFKEPMSLLNYQDATIRGLEFEGKYAEYWNSTAEQDGQIVDAVIMPVLPHAALIPGKLYHIGYTEAINLMNYSSVVIPVTKANKDVDVVDGSYKPANDLDRRNWEAYDPEIYHGGPVGLQIVGRKFEEEKVLAIAKIVVAAMETAKGKASR